LSYFVFYILAQTCNICLFTFQQQNTIL